MPQTSPESSGIGDLTLYRFPGTLSDITVSGTVKPDYVLHSYTESIYKLVRFKRSYGEFLSMKKLDKSLQVSNDQKLKNNLSRARSMVLQYALCNPWDYFFTGTIDKTKYDRFDLGVYASALSQWIRDRRKEYGTQIQYLLVPERHKDGAWHIHGLLANIPEDKLSRFIPGVHPQRLVDGDYWDWSDYRKKFGFCSIGLIRDPVGCSFYISKYISKHLDSDNCDCDALGRHLYFHSRPLSTAKKVASAYGSHLDLDRYLTTDYTFCSVGMIFDKDWTFSCDAPFGEDLPLIPTLQEDPVSDGPVALQEPDCPEWEQMQLSF